MKNEFLIAASMATLFAAGAHAAPGDGGPKRGADMDRADVEARVTEHFQKMDADSDGTVTEAEAKAARETMMAERSGEMFAKADTDGSGAISEAEWNAMAEKRGGKRAGARHKGGNMMMRADADGDGRITLAEAKAPALDRFDRADTDKDGTVTAAERRAQWQTMRAERGKGRTAE
jgi:Ca2+-binding EF-hand superfamily protein|tara:strand:- start:59950 stop:60477 length:528 start_codon:yes stop_codon:yes gene_type:complete